MNGMSSGRVGMLHLLKVKIKWLPILLNISSLNIRAAFRDIL